MHLCIFTYACVIADFIDALYLVRHRFHHLAIFQIDLGYECSVCMYVYALHACLMPAEVERGHQIDPPEPEL